MRKGRSPSAPRVLQGAIQPSAQPVPKGRRVSAHCRHRRRLYRDGRCRARPGAHPRRGRRRRVLAQRDGGHRRERARPTAATMSAVYSPIVWSLPPPPQTTPHAITATPTICFIVADNMQIFHFLCRFWVCRGNDDPPQVQAPLRGHGEYRGQVGIVVRIAVWVEVVVKTIPCNSCLQVNKAHSAATNSRAAAGCPGPAGSLRSEPQAPRRRQPLPR